MQLLFRLIESFGTSGNEGIIRNIISKEIKPYVDDLMTDKLGNLIAHKKGKEPKLMIAAHMDEIGLMTKSIDERGRIYFSNIGGINPLVLIGHSVYLIAKKSKIHGVITTEELSNDFSVQRLPKIEDLFVDTGLSKKHLIKLGIRPGNYLILEHKLNPYLGNKNLIAGKALDDRIGCYILVELIKQLENLRNEVFFVFTVQEEIGLYGAKTSAYRINPDWAVAVDVTNADDMSSHPTIILGKGPCLTIKDADMVSSRCLNNHLEKIAKKKNIPIQYDVSDFGATDAVNIAASKEGVASTVICIPVRNLHSTIGIAHKKDITNAIQLLKELIKNPPKTCDD
ncbi:M42 family metallopeptidase [Candidatus Woesearchaeota archaeon]|nr:M42 family metallopeptidase [Candidatus Woesearchaeota archaeon]